MDLYLTSLVLGVVGLAAMAVSGLGARGGHAASHGHAGHGHAGHGHAGHAGHGHAGHAQGGQAHSTHASAGHSHGLAGRALGLLMSPRFLFSFALGAGAVGLIARPIGEPFLLPIALGGGFLFERLIVSPLWNLSMRFASSPASTLESAVSDEATAVTAFDANGQGIVSIEVDGQIVQILATLRRDDRVLAGPRIRAGQKVRVEDVDPEKGRCTISLI